MDGFLTVGSLVLGLISWGIPLVLLARKTSGMNAALKGSVISLGCALGSLLMEILYTNHLVTISDVSAILDTQGAIVFGAFVLVTVTGILNGLLLKQLLGHRTY